MTLADGQQCSIHTQIRERGSVTAGFCCTTPQKTPGLFPKLAKFAKLECLSPDKIRHLINEKKHQ